MSTCASPCLRGPASTPLQRFVARTPLSQEFLWKSHMVLYGSLIIVITIDPDNRAVLISWDQAIHFMQAVIQLLRGHFFGDERLLWKLVPMVAWKDRGTLRATSRESQFHITRSCGRKKKSMVATSKSKIFLLRPLDPCLQENNNMMYSIVWLYTVYWEKLRVYRLLCYIHIQAPSTTPNTPSVSFLLTAGAEGLSTGGAPNSAPRGAHA